MVKVEKKEAIVPVDMPRRGDGIVQLKEDKNGWKDTTFLKINLDDYPALQPQQHSFINTMLQMSNQILGLRQQYQQHLAAYEDITQTIKDMKAGKIREVYETKGGLFLIKKKVDKKYIGNLIKRRQEILNANNMSVGQLQKNYEVFASYRHKVAIAMGQYLDDKDKMKEVLELEKEIDNEARNLLKGIVE
jgi:hypothetical protein